MRTTYTIYSPDGTTLDGEVDRANWLDQFPNEDPESLPAIAGTAIVFDRIVWT